MAELEADFDYYLSLVEDENKIIIVTREGKDFAALIPPKEYHNLTDNI